MKKILPLFFVLYALSSWSQSFAPLGAQWTYNDYDGSVSGFNYPRAIVSVADTMIAGQSCRIIVGNCLCSFQSAEYVYDDNGKVFRYDGLAGNFSLLYDFNLQTGERWTIIPPSAPQDSFVMRVLSVTIQYIQGMNRRVQQVVVDTSYGANWSFNGIIIEGIGSTGCLYPQPGICLNPTDGLRCYEDQNGIYQTGISPSCDSIFTVATLQPEFVMQRIAMVYPNPALSNEMINIEHQENDMALLIYHSSGLLIEKFDHLPGAFSLPAKGVHIIQVVNRETGIRCIRVVVI